MLAAVLIAAVLILAVPLGLLMLLGKVGGDDAPAFDPAVGTCVKQSGQGGATAADCGEAGAFTIVSKVDAKEKCADTTQPHVVLPGDGDQPGALPEAGHEVATTDGGVTGNRGPAARRTPGPSCLVPLIVGS